VRENSESPRFRLKLLRGVPRQSKRLLNWVIVFAALPPSGVNCGLSSRTQRRAEDLNFMVIRDFHGVHDSSGKQLVRKVQITFQQGIQQLLENGEAQRSTNRLGPLHCLVPRRFATGSIHEVMSGPCEAIRYRSGKTVRHVSRVYAGDEASVFEQPNMVTDLIVRKTFKTKLVQVKVAVGAFHLKKDLSGESHFPLHCTKFSSPDTGNRDSLQ